MDELREQIEELRLYGSWMGHINTEKLLAAKILNQILDRIEAIEEKINRIPDESMTLSE
jgi:uncharacterized protein (UPF0335 family)